MEFRDVRGLSARLAAAGVTTTPYEISHVRPGTHLGISSPTVTLIIDLHDGLRLTGPGLVGPTTYRCCIGGLHDAPFTIHHDGVQRGVQIDLSPAGIRRTFGIPVAELGPSTFSLDLLAPDLSARLYENLRAAPASEQGRVAAGLLADAVATRFDERSSDAGGDAFVAWDAIIAARGRITVAELVERSGWSARHLTGLFTAEFGMGPKQAARLVRFDAARRALDAGGAAVDVAFDAGYADQAHMSREFAGFLGLSPRGYLRQRANEYVPDDRA